MPRLLFTVWPYPTHLHPFIALAREARARDYEVAFYTGGDALAALAREGFRCFPFCEVDWGRVASTVDDLIAGRKRPSAMRLMAEFPGRTVPAQVRDLQAVLARISRMRWSRTSPCGRLILILRELAEFPW